MKIAAIFFLITLIISSIAVYLFSQSIRLDEAQTIWVATKPLETMLLLVGGDVHVPLYFVIMHFWMQVWGTDVTIVRIPSFVFFLLTLLVIYILGREASNKNTSLLSVVLFSLSPFVLWYSFEARMYTQFVFFSSLSHLFFLRLVRSGGGKGALGFFLATLGGMYTHYFFLSIPLSQGVYLLFWSILKSPVRTSILDSFLLQIKVLRKFLIIILLDIVLLLPWIVYVATLGRISDSTPLIPPPNTFNFFQTFAFFLFGFQSVLAQGLIVALWPMLLLLLFLIFTHRKKFQTHNLGYFELVTFFPILLFFVASFVKPVFLARYLIFTVPTLFFLVANVLLVFPSKISKVLISITLVFIIGFLLYQNISPSTPVKENYRGVSQFLNSQVSPSDIVVVSSPFTVYPIEYNYAGNARIDTIPLWDRFTEGGIPAFSDVEFQTQFAEYQKVYNRVFVVLSYDQGYENNIRTYLDTHFEMLGNQLFSPGLEIRVYKLRYN